MTSQEKGDGEMSFKMRLLIACAVAAIASMAVAAVAFGFAWKDKGTNIASTKTINLTGGEVWESPTPTSGMSCEVLATLQMETGGLGKITKWEVKNCGGGFGEFTGCSVLATEAKNLPWTVDLTTADFKITNMRIRRTFKAGCKKTELDKTVAEMTVTPNKTTEMSEMEFTGTKETYKSFGSFKVDSPNAATYGWGL
jgi:hypothetical protein